jgi:hypothetical protein
LSYVFHGHQALTDGGDNKDSHKRLKNISRKKYEQAHLYGGKKGGWFMDDEIQIEMEVSEAQDIDGRLA